MHVIRRRGWEMPESRATPEHLFFNRRALLIGAAGARGDRRSLREIALAQRITDLPDPSARSLSGQAQRRIYARPPDHAGGDQRQLQQFLRVRLEQGRSPRQAQALKIRPWTIKIDGMVEKPIEIGIDDLIRKMPSRSGSIVIAASRPGRWRSRGPAFRWRSWSSWRSRCRRRNTSAWRPSSTSRSRRASGSPGIRGPMSRA